MAFETGLCMHYMPRNQIIQNIRPVSEFIASQFIEFSKELKNHRQFNTGIFISNQFISPMFWTLDEDISLDEIMNEVDKFLENYIFYRQFSQGKEAINDGLFKELVLSGYNINVCNFTDEDLLNDLKPLKQTLFQRRKNLIILKKN